MNSTPVLLYIDDEQINLELFELTFEDTFRIILKDSGEEGLEFLKEQSGKIIVITDLKMPGMSGTEFIRKASSMFPEHVYFILSGFSLTPECQELINSGTLKEYFVKPLNKYYVKEVISKYL